MGITFRKLLVKGDRRTIGGSMQVVQAVLTEPKMIGELFMLLTDEDEGVRMRAADALEKICKQKPELLTPFADSLLHIGEKTDQQEVQWHVAQLLEHLLPTLNRDQLKQSHRLLLRYYGESASAIVKVSSLTALVALAQQSQKPDTIVTRILSEARESSVSSVRARARKLSDNNL